MSHETPEGRKQYQHDYYLAHKKEWNSRRPTPNHPCACGCGELVGYKFALGHNKRGMPDLERIRRQTFRGRRNACLRPEGRSYGTIFTLTIKDVPLIPKDCPCCHKEWDLIRNMKTVENRPSLDRIIPSGGYIPGNVVWICGECNRRLSDSTSTDLYRLAKFREVCEKTISQ